MSSGSEVRPPLIADDLAEAEVHELRDDDDFDGAVVNGTDLSGSDAAHVRFSGCRLRTVRFTASELDRLQLHDVVLDDCDLSGARVERAVLRRVRFERCRLPGAVLTEASLEDVVFEGCLMTGVSLCRARAERLLFDDCLLEEADFSQASLPGARFDRSVLTRALMKGAGLTGARFGGAELSGLRGVASLSGAIISSVQVVPLGERFIAEAGITVDDGEVWADG